MKSRAIPEFWKLFHNLPPNIQQRAYKTYHLWRTNPFMGGLHFKRVSQRELIYSVRIGRSYRALGLLEGDTIYWYFIGNHDEYDRYLKNI